MRWESQRAGGPAEKPGKFSASLLTVKQLVGEVSEAEVLVKGVLEEVDTIT